MPGRSIALLRWMGKRYYWTLKPATPYPSYWLQLAAYKELLKEEHGYMIDHVAILWLNAKTRTEGKKGQVQGIGWQMLTKDDMANDLRLFNATHELWKAENATMKPKQVSYQLSHKL